MEEYLFFSFYRHWKILAIMSAQDLKKQLMKQALRNSRSVDFDTFTTGLLLECEHGCRSRHVLI